jgi:uncharacterized membrane protein (DUF485 family)
MTINEMGEGIVVGRGRPFINRERDEPPTAPEVGAPVALARTSAARKCKNWGGNTMDDQTVKRIQSDPNYQKLVAERKSFGWTLAIITLVIYYGFIALVAFAPSVIAIPVAGSITVGLILGVAIIIASILLTGIYVMRANSHYDDLTKAIVNAAMGGK